MANYQSIGSVAEAVARLLRQAWQPALLGGIEPQFDVYQGKDFSTPMAQGVSVFVYQVTVDQVQRTLPPAASDHRRPLPVRISFLLTAWGQDASTEHDLLGWAMRTIADTPVLSSGFLNAAVPGVFRPEETAELVPMEMSDNDVFQLWQVLPGSLQLSVPYIARVVRVESDLTVPQGAPVQVRELAVGTAAG
ncbi:DUF4255 domain-containing protein [Streptomyces sp. NPDC056660]|uniref:DUF4255 domain-containing protein n=1 Tax=Streptomyces sp. NPDC056660 TaxID=3345897 RepID=UPI0036C1194F